jgi:UDP-N-acetylmuramate: L-alanyl-gamma-D-glutamyl-meso-diaminopimelate ligase
MLAWIFHAAGRNPSFLIGGIAENFGSSFAVNDSADFILEGDEYDTAFFDKGPKFLHYFPKSLILTAVEFDHADIYKNLDEVKTAFKRLVNLVPRSGHILAWDGHRNVDECVAKAFCKVERYGFGEQVEWRIAELEHAADHSRWQVLRAGQPWARFQFPLAGDYNVLNATASAAMAAHYGIAPSDIAEALRHFKSVKRRLEVKAEVRGITIIDDFAHHPTAIAETLKALRSRYAGRRLWAVLEPRSNTLRRNVFQTELVQSLRLADRVVLANIFKSEAIPEAERLDPAHVIADLNAQGTPAELQAGAEEITASLAPQLQTGDVVAILSNGGFGGIYEKLPARIERGA